MREPSTCLHLGLAQVGYTETPVQHADASVAGLVVFTGIYSCPGCGQLVAGVVLSPKGSKPVLATKGHAVLHRTTGEGVRHG